MSVLPTPWPLAILRLEASEDRVDALVASAPDALRTSAVPGMSGRLLASMPGLMSHECDNGKDCPFAEELADTETAHALEHVALQLLRMAGYPGVRGETRWDFRQGQHGRFRVAITGAAPTPAAEEALRTAAEFVAAAADGRDMPNAATEAARIRASAGGTAPS